MEGGHTKTCFFLNGERHFILTILENTEKHLCLSLFLNKVSGLRLTTLLKKKLWHRCFAANFTKFLRTPFLIQHLRWLLLSFYFKKIHHDFFNNQSLELSSLREIDNIIQEEEEIFKKNPTPINHQSNIAD